MTANRKAKRAIRSRMAQTGEKYTQARRALPEPPDPPTGTVADALGGDAIGAFTDQGYNAILLAEDEARMLGHARVEPEHLLLAAARYGNVKRLLAREGIVAGAIHAAIVRLVGFEDALVLGRVPRSSAGETVLARSIAAAAERGIGSPSTEHLLLGLDGEAIATAVFRDLALTDVTALVDGAHPVRRPPLDRLVIARRAVVACARTAPRPGPMPPVFERFTVEARAAVEAAVGLARSLENEYVTPAHLLAGLLGAGDGVIAGVHAERRDEFEAVGGLTIELLSGRPVGPTGIFSAPARRLVAEDVPAVAHRLGHRPLGTGHLFLAAVANPDPPVAELRLAFRDLEDVMAAVAAALPGDERV